MSDTPSIAMAPSGSIRILLVEDDDGCALLLKTVLTRWRYGAFSIKWADSLSAAVSMVAEGGIDIILLDLGLPDSHGFDTFARMHAAAGQVPIVVLSGSDDEELATRMIQQGAQDYIVKGLIMDGASLARSIRFALDRCHAQQVLEAERKNSGR